MNNFLLWLAAIVIVVLGALFAVPMFVDWNSYRGTFEREMTKVIGREIRIGGDVALRLLPTPYLSMEKVRIADATGRFDTPLLRLERFTVWLSTTPLVRGQIEAREIEFQRPELRLAIDSAGRGNWIGLGSGENLAFLPSSVALNSARVVDGSLQFVLPEDRGTLAFAEINGEVAADSLQGPFRFKGNASFNGAVRDIRVDTDVFSDGGKLPVRGSLSQTGSGDTYSFNGLIEGLTDVPRAEGKLDARLPLGATADGSALELSSRIVATIEGLKLKQISLAHLHKERMQKVEGEAEVGFGEHLDIALRLGGRNLDLDQLLASRQVPPVGSKGAGDGLYAKVSAVVEQLAGWLPATANSRIEANFEQIVLAGEQLGGVAIDVRHADGRMRLQSLTARLPGSTDLELAGDIAGTASAVDFTGDVRVTGRNLPRLLKWIYPSAVITTPHDPAFMIDAAVELGGQRLHIDAKRAEIAGTSINGALTFVDGPARSLDLKIAGNLFDLSDVEELSLPAGGIIEVLVLALGGKGADGVDKEQAPSWTLADAGLANAHIDARIGHLKSAGGSLRDIAADLTLADDRLTVGRFSVATESGLELSASGALDKVTVAPAGQLGFEIDAGDPTAVAELERLIGNGLLLPPGLSQRRDAAPLRMAGIARFGERGPGSIDLNLDGSVGSSPAQLGIRVDGKQSSLGKRHIELSARLENASITRLLGQITGSEFATTDTVSVDSLALDSSSAAMDLRLSGVPAELMSCAFSLDGGGIRADYDGRLRSAADGIELEGGLKLSIDSLENAVTLAGLPLSGGLPRLPVTVAGELARSGNSYRLTKAKAKLGDSEFSGTFSLGGQDGKSTIAVVGEVNSASLPTVLAAMFAKPGAAPPVAAADTAIASPWSSAPLTFAVVERLTGRVDLTFEQLELVEGLSLERTRLAANLSGGKVDFETIEGSLLGGTLATRISVGPGDSGIVISGNGEAKDLQLQALTETEGAPARARGSLGTRFAWTSRGVDAAGLVDNLVGEGVVEVSAGSLDRLNPLMIDGAAEAALANASQLSVDSVRAAVDAQRPLGSLAFPAMSIPAKIDAGALRLQTILIDGDAAKLTVDTMLGLASLNLTSRWKITAKSKFAGGEPLPPVSITYAGPVRDLTRLEPAVDVTELEGELARRAVLLEFMRGSSGAAPEQLLEVPDASGSIVDPNAEAAPGLVEESAPLIDGNAAPIKAVDAARQEPANGDQAPGDGGDLNVEAVAIPGNAEAAAEVATKAEQPGVVEKPVVDKKVVKQRPVRKKPKAVKSVGGFPFPLGPERLGGPQKARSKPSRPKPTRPKPPVPLAQPEPQPPAPSAPAGSSSQSLFEILKAANQH